MTYANSDQIQCIRSKGKPTFCIVNSDMACIPTDLASLIHNKAEKNHVLRIGTIQQEIGNPEKEEQ